MIRLRLRGPNGVATLSLADDTTIKDLKKEIALKSNVDSFDLKVGYPPQPLDLDGLDPSSSLSQTSLKLNGQQLIVSPKPTANPSADAPKQAAAPLSAAAPASSSIAPSQPNADDPPELPVPNHNGVLLMRVMPDDNSCLFRAISAAVLGPEIDSMHELRSSVASHIRQHPDIYNAAILDKDPERYCRWIQRPEAWGGAIEIGILAEIFQIEIASINVADGRVDRFNEKQPKRCILVYSGIHYDVLAVSQEDSLGLGFRRPPEQDIKLFDTNDDELLVRAVELCDILRKQKYYTDTQSFSIKCNVCGWTGNGEMEAVKHASATGHENFGEAS